MKKIPKIIAISILLIIGIAIIPAMVALTFLGANDPFYHYVKFADEMCEIFNK